MIHSNNTKIIVKLIKYVPVSLLDRIEDIEIHSLYACIIARIVEHLVWEQQQS